MSAQDYSQRSGLRPDPARLEQALAALLGSSVSVAAEDPATRALGLWPTEATAMARAVDRRCREFAAGRRAARRALALLEHPACALPMAADRAPVWPTGLCGSISHGGGACAAVAARQDRHAALGLDLEPDADLPSDLLDHICRPEERVALLRTGHPLRQARRLFSAKECAYKAQYALSQSFLDFDALQVVLTETGFVATFQVSVPGFPAGSRLTGRQGTAQGLILSALTLPAPEHGA